MSRYRHWWYPNIARELKAYPALLAKKDALRGQTVIAKYSPDPKGGGASRSTENIALKDLPPREAASVDAISSALDEVARRKDGGDIIKLVDMVYFRGSHTIQGAAIALNMTEITARRKNGDFITSVAKKLGYLSK